MPKIKNKNKKKQEGGAVDLQFLLISDTFHDFWNFNRGAFKIPRNAKWKQLLNYKLIELIGPQRLINQNGSRIPAYIVNPLAVPAYDEINLSPICTQIFFENSEYFVDTLGGGFENLVATYMNTGLNNEAADYPIEWKGVPQIPHNDDINELFRTLFNIPEQGALPYVIHFTCDMAPGVFGDCVRGNPRFQQIITPQNIGDSAPRGFEDVGGEANIYVSPYNEAQGIYLSNSNLFTTFGAGYRIRYTDVIGDGAPLNFNYQITGSTIAGNIELDNRFGGEGMYSRGSSAAQLAGLYLEQILPQQQIVNESPEAQDAAQGSAAWSRLQVNVTNEITNLLNRGPILKHPYENGFRAISTELDARIFRGFIDKNIFLDIKRGGDRDQVMAAVILRHHFPNLVFVTGDLLCATQAVKQGLPTVYQNPAGARRLIYWAAGAAVNAGMWGGSSNKVESKSNRLYKNRLYKNSMNSNDITDDEDDNLIYETVSIELFLEEISANIAIIINSYISTDFKELNELTCLYRIITALSTLQRFKTLNEMSFGELNMCLESYNYLVETSKKIELVKNTRKFNFDEFNSKVYKMISNLEAEIINMKEKQNNVIKDLESKNLEGLRYDIEQYISKKFNKNKPNFLKDKTSYEVYTYIYNKIIKENKNNSQLIAFAILNTIIRRRVNIQMSPVMFLYFQNKKIFPNLDKLSNTNANDYLLAYKNIINQLNRVSFNNNRRNTKKNVNNKKRRTMKHL